MTGQTGNAVEAKRQRVLDALSAAVEAGGEVTIRGIARAAGVDHVFIMRREDLREQVASHERRRRVAPEDVHGGDASGLSAREKAAVDQVRGKTPQSAWIREAVLQRLEREGTVVPDEARRPAPRRRNLSERQQREDRQES